MAGTVVSDNFETSTGAIPQLGGADVTTRLCSAWVNFNGSGTVAIRASYNVSSITDNGTGDYTANFTTAMPDVNYSVSCGQCDSNNGRGFGVYDARGTFTNQLVSSVRVRNAAVSTDTLDIVNASVTIHSN
tara:strand:+ start:15953 stop:16345 length:393 start_codon:yes stop_codon:yes gene_type:complete